MSSSKLPPAKVVRAIEFARHHLERLHRRMVPPHVAMMEMIVEAWAAQAITSASDLRLADALAKGPLSAEELAIAVNADADAVSRLLRALVGRGIFRQRRDGRYDLTPLADTLRSDAEVSLAGMARWVGSPQHREHWSRLTQAVRTGRPVVPELRGKPAFDYLADEPELAEIFNRAMTSTSELSIAPVIAAYDFSSFGTIVDVAGGHGRLLAAILAATPAARGVLFDLPQVVTGAPEVLQENHVADRVRVEEGSFFDEDIPGGGDAYVLKNIIHDWSDDDAVRILRNVRTAAGAGKKVLLVEFVIPPHDREFTGKWVDLEMLVVVPGRERTATEYGQLLDRAGFRMTRVVETASPYSLVEATAV
ncbi:Multifunctional cyclase-dehydratase-3-O-methyl transferase TcmN [Mycobacterium simulans]|uniref:Multifunctional cyclase-dehydratase-3-O-methyl transferase TcmN n=1 Tax=Mycobacterium simulans TaxID=627089 RepID=A0A7Z7IN70_9MYCO|nr:methyltransferase [Mycobacterium simulans]SOJ56710.1 Multifunctional cyclase-dehydratase-3-O-methyl transferase TcmN [Mycobacterium simulans]